MILGFHGCEKNLAREIILNRAALSPSCNDYDWLGGGIYFWENDPIRALEFARDVKQCEEPYVVGAILDLQNCLDLTTQDGLSKIRTAWETLVKPAYESGQIKPNKPGRKGENGELLLRYLDCAVIRALHDFYEEAGVRPFDSVRAGFWEGDALYPTAGFFQKNHIQICVRSPQRCIKGYFLPPGSRFIL